MLGEMWGFDSRCKQSSLVLSGFVRGTLTQGNGCYQHHCRNKTLEIVVEEPKQQKTTPPSRPSKGLALPSANNESISLLLRNLCPPHGTMSVIGRRREMEDVVAGVPSFFSLPKPTVLLQNSLTRFAAPAPTPLHFFGVYDGHGGSQASIYCKNRFHKDLAEKLRDASSFSRDLSYWNQVMSARFMKMDMAVGGMCPNGGCSSNADVQMISDCCRNPVAPENVGSTAFVSPTQFVIANCGDSRAVLSRGGKVIPLSNDHKSEREDEMGCIEAAGGHAIYWNGYPVGGFLAMSRAPGVRFLKRYVISEPKVTCTEQTNEDQCLILASDGLWDVLSNDIVCEVARKCLAGFRPHCSKGITEDTPVGAAAALLTKLAGLNILNPRLNQDSTYKYFEIILPDGKVSIDPCHSAYFMDVVFKSSCVGQGGVFFEPPRSGVLGEFMLGKVIEEDVFNSDLIWSRRIRSVREQEFAKLKSCRLSAM
ncbi:probable protein phosphatase 2C 24 [Cryptomeria japonica]|uniref:probable protein phosphatase 2C 24 n=1 Tax=Cryptomeria japonica TaxID=3369 RepID=UPI0027D9EF40|nr:probable protein phosphatase 2C 24 [Cryptomeria japonica]